MSTPIKPPDAGDRPTPADDSSAAPVEEAPGEFQAVLEAAAERTGATAASVAEGSLQPGQAVERLVQRALAGAEGLSAGQREALEAQLRAALADEPTLVALQEDLRASET